MRFWFIPALLVAGTAGADAFVAPEIAHLSSGVICAGEVTGTRPAPDTVAGETFVIEEVPRFVSDGPIVPAMLGVGFGVVSAVAGEFPLEGVRVHIFHPPFPGSGAIEQSFETRIGPVEDPGFSIYQFDLPYELATGDWAIEARIDDYVLYRQEFLVVAPGQVPELAEICDFEELLS